MAEETVGPDLTGDGKLDLDITDAGDFGTINGAIFGDAANVGSGTGNYNTFLSLHDDPNDSDEIELGFNAGQSGGGAKANPEDSSNSEMGDSTSSAILLGAIPIIIVNGIAYYEFRVDLNENNSGTDPLVSLDQFQLFVGPYDLDADPPNPVPSTSGQNDPNIDLVDTIAEVQALTKVYDMDAGGDVSVLMDEFASSGSGTDDYSVLVPVSNFAGLDPATTYVYLLVQMGAADPDPDDTSNNIWGVSGGFHEWNLQNAVIIQGQKFNDINGDGDQDAGEGGVEGVTIYIDDNLNGVVDPTDNNGVLDVLAGEQSDITDANGNYSFGGIPIFDADYTIHIREIVPDGSVPTTDLPVEVVIDSSLAAGTVITSTNVPGLLIGNHLLSPSIAITKSASVAGDCADTVGELITYTIVVDNDGELTLTNVVLEDNFEGGGNVTLVVTGDTNANTILDVGEVWRTGDTNSNSQMETTETWTYTYVRAVTQAQIDSNGGGNGTLTDVATVNANSANGSVTGNDDASVAVCQDPALSIVKSASVDGDCADTVGELISYSVVLDNIGNVALDNVVLEDDFEAGGNVTLTVTGDTNANTILDVGEVWLSGDTGGDSIMGVDETWTYSYVRAVTQEQIDSNGGGDGTLDNLATANADAVNSDTAADEVTDDASVAVCQDPAITIEKSVKTNINNVYADADTVPGLEASTVSTVDFRVVVSNTGNVALENVTLSDTVDHDGAETNEVIDYNSINAQIDIDNDGIIDGLFSDYDEDGDGTLDDADGNFATVDDFVLASGASFAVYYSLDSALGQHENTAVVTADAATTGTDVTAEDDANYYVLPSEDCVGVRTPGFWSNSKWMTFWDGEADNEPDQAGTPGFASGELIYDVFLSDTNGDSVIDDSDNASFGLLVGDYNMNGITDAGEDTIFISHANAVKLINASQKQQGDGTYMLGRDMVATWLNYLANNEETIGECIGDVGGAVSSPQEYLDAAIDWMQQFASDKNDGGGELGSAEVQATFKFDGAVKTNHVNWQSAFTGVAGTADDIPVSAAQMHSALDAYNNTGMINGEEFCCDADSQIALLALTQVSLI